MRSMHCTRHGGARGFTLIELLVTISIMAILAAIAFPSFSYSLRNNRVGTQTNELLAALNYARNEAVTRGRGVTICAADTSTGAMPTDCGSASDWKTGWMVFLDSSTGSSAPTVGDRLRMWEGNPKNDLETDAGEVFIRFDPRGQAIADGTPAEITFTLKPASDCSNDQQRRITVTALGRSGSAKEACT
ncbi:MAG: GspH/FimT family pseudopilin [Xanthomonadales bacterium]|nr:GspH/FimT family pseudopilin [Xanthomonadales bacterium]